MKYNPELPYQEQTDEVKMYIQMNVIDQTKEPAERDYLNRPARFEFLFEDEDKVQYLCILTNEYIDNRSWRLHKQTITVEPKVG